jgi:hypothetical protein
MPGRFRPADHTKGDANTIGGYMAVHDRPAAFEGSDGFSYSVEILTEESEAGDAASRWTGYLFFVKWARLGAQSPEGHLESTVLVTAGSEDEARARVGAIGLDAVKRILDDLIATRDAAAPKRRWWDAMRDESES